MSTTKDWFVTNSLENSGIIIHQTSNPKGTIMKVKSVFDLLMISLPIKLGMFIIVFNSNYLTIFYLTFITGK